MFTNVSVKELNEAERAFLKGIGYRKHTAIKTPPKRAGEILKWQSGWQGGSMERNFGGFHSSQSPLEIHGIPELNHPNDPFKQCKEWMIPDTCWIIVSAGIFQGKQATAVITEVIK